MAALLGAACSVALIWACANPGPTKAAVVAPAPAPSGATTASLASARDLVVATAAPTTDGGSAFPGVILRDGPATGFYVSRFEPQIALSSDGRRAAAVLKERIVLWDASTGAELRRWHLVAEGIAFTSNEALVTVARRTKLRVLAEDGGFHEVGDASYLLVVSPDGAWAAAKEMERNEVVLFDLRTGAKSVIASGVRAVQTSAFSPDGSRFCLVLNDAKDDLPSGGTRILVFERDTTGRWRKLRTHAIAGALQDNDASMLSRKTLLLDKSTVDVDTGALTELDAPGLEAVSADGRGVLLSDRTGMAYWFAPVVDGHLGARLALHRPPNARGRGHPAAIAARGEVLWCIDSECVAGPPVYP